LWLIAPRAFPSSSSQPNSIGWSEKRWPARSASMTVSATVRAAGFCRSSGSTASA